MISVETNYNELKYNYAPVAVSQTPSSFFDYEKLRTNTKNIKTTPKLMGKSSSMVSLKCKEIDLCKSETKSEFYQTPVAIKKEPKFHQTQPKDSFSSCHLTSLDQNISAVLQKLKTMSSRGTENKAKKSSNARS